MLVYSEHYFTPEMLKLYALLLEIIKGSSVFYYNPRGLECHSSWLQQHNLSSQPQWAWRSSVPYLHMRVQHNSELFVLACLPGNYNKDELKGLSSSLLHLRNVKILIEITESENDQTILAKNILLFFRQHKMVNVLLHFQSSQNPLILYSFRAFPQFRLLQHNFNKSVGLELYPNQIEDLQGHTLKVLPDFSEPNTFIYIKKNGTTEIRGFMWDFIEAFAAKIGARIEAVYPTWERGRTLSEFYALDMTKNGTLDIGLLTASLQRISFDRYYQYSHPLLLASWCVMLPLERPIGIPAIFKHVLGTEAWIVLMIALICCGLSWWLGGLCWRSAKWNCYWRFGLSFLHRWMKCLCLAQLLFLMILNPRKEAIDSFEALLHSDLRILVVNSEFYLLDGEFRAQYAGLFRLTDVSEFFGLRNSFNTSFAYSITSNKWKFMQIQQRNFHRSIFRYSDLCFHGHTPYSAVLDEDSIYFEAIKRFTLRIYDVGLMSYWQTKSFYDMARAGRMHFKDYSVPIELRPLRLQDFKIPCCYLSLGLILAFSLFAFELLRFYIGVFLENL